MTSTSQLFPNDTLYIICYFRNARYYYFHTNIVSLLSASAFTNMSIFRNVLYCIISLDHNCSFDSRETFPNTVYSHVSIEYLWASEKSLGKMPKKDANLFYSFGIYLFIKLIITMDFKDNLVLGLVGYTYLDRSPCCNLSLHSMTGLCWAY